MGEGRSRVTPEQARHTCRRHYHVERRLKQATPEFSWRVPLLGATAIPAAAQEGCTGFGWPMGTEIAWMTSADSEAIESGAKMPGLAAKAIDLKLKPSKEVTLPVKPGMKKQGIAADSYSGWFEIASLPKGGRYQVTLSHEGWIDAVQNGELVNRTDLPERKAAKPFTRASVTSLALGRSRSRLAERRRKRSRLQSAR